LVLPLAVGRLRSVIDDGFRCVCHLLLVASWLDGPVQSRRLVAGPGMVNVMKEE
jgi:hypothetical protein